MKKSAFSFLGTVKLHEVFTHIYKNSSESWEIAARFILEGLKAEQKCIYISDTGIPEGIITRLHNNSLGIGNDEIRNNVRDIKIMNLNNHANCHRNSAFLEGARKKLISESGKKGGHPVRFIISKDPAFVYHPESFEMNTSLLIIRDCEKLPAILMYQFHINRISSEDLLNIMKVNRHIVENDRVFKSVFYEPPGNLAPEAEEKHDLSTLLTIQEKKVLNGIINGLSNKKIAINLSLSTRTVESHRANIMKKLKVNNLVDLVKFAIKKGLI